MERKTTKKLTFESFVMKANVKHNNEYCYNKVVYTNNKNKVIITCPIHGDFQQTPKAHTTLKQGCPSCYYEKVKNNAPSWTKEKWVDAGNNSLSFDGFKLYIIKCFNELESFYKVGRTYTKLYRRFTQIPYNIEIIKLVTSNDGGYIFDLEKRLKRKYKYLKYQPKIDFGGKHECFKPLD